MAAVNSHYKLVLSISDKPWLFDLEKDPTELVNLWDDPKYAAVKADMIETIRKDLLARPMFHNRPIPGALI